MESAKAKPLCRRIKNDQWTTDAWRHHSENSRRAWGRRLEKHHAMELQPPLCITQNFLQAARVPRLRPLTDRGFSCWKREKIPKRGDRALLSHSFEKINQNTDRIRSRRNSALGLWTQRNPFHSERRVRKHPQRIPLRKYFPSQYTGRHRMGCQKIHVLSWAVWSDHPEHEQYWRTMPW